MADEKEKDDREQKSMQPQTQTQTQSQSQGQSSCLNILSYDSEDDPEYNPDDEQPEETEEDEEEQEEEMEEQQISRTDNDIEMCPQTAIPNLISDSKKQTLGTNDSYSYYGNAFNTTVTPSDLADIAAATAAGVPILNAEEEDDNEGSGSSSSSNDGETTEEEDDEDEEEEEEEEEEEDDNEYPDLDLLCLPMPFTMLLERYLRDGLFYSANRRETAIELAHDLEEFRHKYTEDKAKYTLDKWEMRYACYWPKSSRNNNNNNHHNSNASSSSSDDLMNDLLCLEAFRYELYDISSRIMANKCERIDYLRMEYLVKYGILCIEKMQEDYRYIVSRNICLSWSVVVWLTSAVDFCARYMNLDELSALCVALLKSALTCYDCMVNAVGRNHDACKLAKKLIDNACKMEHEMWSHNKLCFRPRFDTFILYVLSRARWRWRHCDIFKKLKNMMNALNEWISSDSDSNPNSNGLPFPWDTAEHLARFLYICEKCAFYYSEVVHVRKWTVQIIDAFYKNILNFPTQHIRVLNDVDAISITYHHHHRQHHHESNSYVANSLTHIMTIFNKMISAIHDDNAIDYDYIGQEFDVMHDGHRMIDISFLSIYMKQIGNSNVETQLRGLTKIDEIMRKIQERCNRHMTTHGGASASVNGGSGGDDEDGGNTNYTMYKHKWLSEPRLAQYLHREEFIKKLFERDSHNKILERSQSIIEFLAQEEEINRTDLQLIWMRCQHKHESQIDAYYKIIKTLSLSLDEENIKYLLQIITATPQHEWDTDYLHLIYTITRFAAETRFKRKPHIITNNETYWFGLHHLWNISFGIITASAAHSLQAQRFVVDLLSLQCFVPQIETYLMQCVAYIRGGVVTNTLQLFKTISIGHNYNAPLLKSIAKENDLLNIIVNDLRNAYATNNNLSMMASVHVNQLQSVIQTQLMNTSQSLQQRLLFIDFLLRFADAQISQSQVKELWQMLVCNPCLGSALKAHALDFFCNAIDPQAQKLHFVDTCSQNQPEIQVPLYRAAFTDEIAHYVGKHLCNTLDAKLMTIKHFNLSKAYFYHIGVADGIFRSSGGAYYLMDAHRLDIDWLWNIVFDAVDGNVSSAAQLLLKDVYTLIDSNTHNNINISSLYEGFIDKCMTCAHNATRNNNGMQPANTKNANTNGIQQALNVLLLNGNPITKQQMNRITIKRCFSLLRMAIDNFGGKRHGNMMHIELIFVEISSKNSKTPKGKPPIAIQMGELQTCRELALRVHQEVCKKCPKGKGFTIKGLIKNGKRIDETNGTLADEFTFESKQVNVVYTMYDIAREEKTNAVSKAKSTTHNGNSNSNSDGNGNSNVLRGPETPDSGSNTSDTVVDVEAMSNDPVIMEQQKQLESSIRSNSCNNSVNMDQRESGLSPPPPPPPPPPSVANQLTTPRATRKQPCFGQNITVEKQKMKQLTLTSMYKKETKRKTITAKKSDYNDFTTGGLTRVDSMVSINEISDDRDPTTAPAVLHPSDILSKSKYFNQLFSFLTYSHDIACQAWEILRKLPLNRDKKLCVKDFNNGWNHMFDLKQHDSVLMARYGLDILSKLTRNDAKMYKERSKNSQDVAMLECMDNNENTDNANEAITQRWIIQFIRKHGLVLVLKLLISINIDKSEYATSIAAIPPPEISCASMVIHFLSDILEIDNEPTSIANEILSDTETSQLFLSPQVLSSIMSIIGILSSFTESVSIASQKVMINPMKFSTQVLKQCFGVLKFILQNDKSHQLIEYFLSSNLRQWIHRLLIRSPYPKLRCMVKSQLQLLYQDHFEMGESASDYGTIKERSQDPRLLVGVVKACLEILGILPVEVADTQQHVSLPFEFADRFHCNEFMDFLHDAIAHLVNSFDILSKQPQYKVLLIEDCTSYHAIHWYQVLDKFMSYFMSYPVTESQQTRPDDTKLLPLKAHVYSTYVNSSNLNDDNTNDEYYADKCLIGVMNIISKLIQTLSNINANINVKLLSFIESVFHRGLFPDIDTIWKQRRDPFQLPLCKQKKTRQSCMELLINIATFCGKPVLCRIQEMMTWHHSSQTRLRKYLNFDHRDDWNYLRNILSRPFNGNVGLVNLGATCYMNSLMQQLFSNKQFRFSVLSRDVEAIRQRHLDEKQKLIRQKRDEMRLDKGNMDLRLKEEKDGEEYKDEDIWKMMVDNNTNNNNKMIVIGDKDDENCEMLNELQNIFTYLQESDLRSYDPLSFCTAYKQPGGRAMELRVQMDVDEFFAVFTDKLEKQLQFDSHCNIIQYLFGGVFATQMIGRKGCKHYREKSDPFVTLTLDVKSKQDIMNSLNSYVQGEVISDYQCDKCMKRIEILKRSCIRILPRNLVIHLKRFDFDIETLGRAKVNDSLQFPPYLDMTPFTKDGLENKEHKKYVVDDNDLTQEEKKDRDLNEKKFNQTYDFESSNMYRLVGIINHSGGTESGHYTSYIRQCNTNSNNNININNNYNSELNHRWSYFNDRIVEQWDCKKIPDDCFGGPVSSYSNPTNTNNANTNNNNTNNNTNNNNTPPSNKMYSAYMLFYERVSMDQRQIIENKMQNGALSKSYYNLTDVLMSNLNNANNHRNNNNNNNNNKVSGRKRQQTDCAEDYQPPHKKQKLSNGQSNSQIQPSHPLPMTCIRREDLIDTEPKAIPKHVPTEQQSNILDPGKRERVWNENKAAVIERQVLEKQYIETCIKTVMLSVPKEDEDPDCKGDLNEELFTTSKLALTLLFETIGHCKCLNQIISKKERNHMCTILSKTPSGCKWFLMKLLATQENHWLRTLYDPKLNRIYGETMGEVVRDLVITALKCMRTEEHKYYKYALKHILSKEEDENTDDDDDEDINDDMDLDIDTSSHCIVAVIRLILEQFPLMDKPEYSHPIFEILMHFAHFGNDERVLLIDLGLIWKGIAYYKKDLNGLQTGVPTKHSDKNNGSSSSSTEVKIGWKRKTLKELAVFKALPQIVSTLITSIHPEYLERFFHEQHVKKQEKAVAPEDWLHSKCLLPSDEKQQETRVPTPPPPPISISPPNLPPKIIGPEPLLPPAPMPPIPKLEKVVVSPFPTENYHRFAIAPNVQKECRLSKSDYIWLKNKDVLEYLLESGTVSHLSEVSMSHLAHSSNILYKRIMNKMTESFNTAFQATLKHLFVVIKLILGVFDGGTTLPDVELRRRCINKIYPKLLTCATTQEAKYHKDAQVLMEFAQELTTSSAYSFAFEVACDENMIELIIGNLFDKNKKMVRHISMLLLKHLIANGSKSVHEAILMQIMDNLSTALLIASNQSLIDNSNESFPDDLKNYVERKAKVNTYFAIMKELMQLYPTVVIPQLTQPDQWNIICETVAALESGADTFSWAKNDDKLMVMQVIMDCIDTYHVDPAQLFNIKLIDALTSQYLVSTRSKVVSTHMTQVVSITYRLLTHFAFNNETGAEWIRNKIVNQHWFLWAISDIVTPHNVYQSSLAAHSILLFIEKLMSLDLECMKQAPTQMISKCVAKWDQMSTTKKLLQYPRESILKLLMLILKSEQHHIQFLHDLHGRKLISHWINNFFLSNILDEKEEISTYNVAFDFFTFHLAQITKFVSLQKEAATHVITLYIEAVCLVFAYDSNRKEVTEWKHILSRASHTLQSIFDLQRVYRAPHNVQIIKHFFMKLSRSEILMFSSNPKDYIRTKNTTDSEEMVLRYLLAISAPKHPILKQIESRCGFIEAKKKMYCYQISSLFEIFCLNYANPNSNSNDKKNRNFNWNGDDLDEEMRRCIASIMISCWFLQLIGCRLPDIIQHNLSQYLETVVASASASASDDIINETFASHPVCWMTFVVLMTSSALQPQMLLNPLTMKLCILLTSATLRSVLEDTHSSKILKEVTTKVLLHYLPMRLKLCVDRIKQKAEDLQLSAYLAYIEYYHHIVHKYSIVVSTKARNSNKMWNGLRHEMDDIINGNINSSNNDNDTDTMRQIVQHLTGIAHIIDSKLQQSSKEENNADVVMAPAQAQHSNEQNVPKVMMKSKTVNKKSKKSFQIKLKKKQLQLQAQAPPPPPPPPPQQQQPEAMTVDTKDTKRNDDK